MREQLDRPSSEESFYTCSDACKGDGMAPHQRTTHILSAIFAALRAPTIIKRTVMTTRDRAKAKVTVTLAKNPTRPPVTKTATITSKGEPHFLHALMKGISDLSHLHELILTE